MRFNGQRRGIIPVSNASLVFKRLNHAFIKGDRRSGMQCRRWGILLISHSPRFLRAWISSLIRGKYFFASLNPMVKKGYISRGSFECDERRQITSTVKSERFDLKSRGSSADLEPRDSWSANWANRYLGELRVLESLETQDLLSGMEFSLIWCPDGPSSSGAVGGDS